MHLKGGDMNTGHEGYPHEGSVWEITTYLYTSTYLYTNYLLRIPTFLKNL